MATALITGTSTGIGQATALHMARQGHQVFATMRNPAQAELGELAKAEGLSITILPLDVDSDASVRAAVEKVLSLVVAEKIEAIISSGNATLRHPVGPDAEPFLKWRQSMSDEEWVSFGALEDKAWGERIKRDLGLELGLD